MHDKLSYIEGEKAELERMIIKLKRRNEELEEEVAHISKRIDKNKSSHEKKIFKEKKENEKLSKVLEIERNSNEKLQKEIELLKQNILNCEDPEVKITYNNTENDQEENLKNLIYDYKQLNDELQVKLTKLRVENADIYSQLQQKKRDQNT